MEFFGEGAASLTVPDRATLGNMAPEYGATMGYFPVDEQTIRYLRSTGRGASEVEACEAYFTAQGLFGMPRPGDLDYSRVLEVDLGTITPGVAGPSGPRTASTWPTSSDVSRPCWSNPLRKAATTNLRKPSRNATPCRSSPASPRSRAAWGRLATGMC